jgi:hypothetical protein
VDLEARLERDHLPAGLLVDNTEDEVRNPEKVVAPYAVEGNDTSGYRGVSQEYMTYANETEKPHTPDEGPEAEAQKRLELGVADVRKTVGLKSEPATEVGVTDTETLNTAVSGEGYSAKLVDAPKDFQGTMTTELAHAGEEPTPTAKTTGASAKSTAAPKTTGTKSNS